MWKKVAVMAVLLIVSSGCGNSRIQILEDAVNSGQKFSQELGTQMGIAIDAIDILDERLHDPNLSIFQKEEIQEVLLIAATEFKKALEKKAVVDSKLNEMASDIAKIKVDGVSLNEELSFWFKGATSVGPMLPPPVGPIFTLAGLIGTAIFGAKNLSNKKLAKGLVRSVDILLKKNGDNGQGKVEMVKRQEDMGIRKDVRKLL